MFQASEPITDHCHSRWHQEGDQGVGWAGRGLMVKYRSVAHCALELNMSEQTGTFTPRPGDQRHRDA